MVFAGRWAGKQNLFVAYERSYPLISPEGYFYPSLDNLTELVSHVASPRKILVFWSEVIQSCWAWGRKGINSGLKNSNEPWVRILPWSIWLFAAAAQRKWELS